MGQCVCGVGGGVGGITISYWSILPETAYKANITMWVSVCVWGVGDNNQLLKYITGDSL